MTKDTTFTRKNFLKISALGMGAVILGSSFTSLLSTEEKPYFNLKPIGAAVFSGRLLHLVQFTDLG
ncbi:hypothetical protein SD427_17175 [Chryseobacterium sp. JJR-5R]|uniref:hypothetical protein n=1 Tax=Chryseobacterium sp. JJR-5R TaxID=3093923 RepID=UPI002A766928|nr:hypothetical protein [Chryseobacterium sp. JJR-5R]WPO82471.1 hypothetical protein SD427_17175 [Chryseobacterium sp. JJR-5R]